MGKLTSVYIRGNLNIVPQRRMDKGIYSMGKKKRDKKRGKKAREVITALKIHIF